MAKFIYKAKNAKGEVVTGTVKAATDYDAEKILVHHNLVAMELIPERKKQFHFSFGGKITMRDRALFARQLATMISAGLPLVKALSIVVSQARNDRIKHIYQAVYNELEEGYSFSNSLAKHPEMFDRMFVSVVNSGETTGQLDVVLDQLAHQLENDSDFVSKIKSVMYYPAVIIMALIGVAIYMVTYVIPQLRVMFDQAKTELPVATKILLAMSDFTIHYWPVGLAGIVVFFVVFKMWLSSEMGASTISHLQLKVPVVNSLSTGIYVSRFTRSMQMLVKAGVPLLDALRTCSSMMKNELYEDDIMRTINKVEKGVPLSVELMKSAVFPQLLGQMVAVGEETGQLDKVMGKVADYYEEDVNNRIKILSTLIEPLVLLVIGFGVAFLVFAILMPIYNLSQVV
ncbi:MAG: Type II secretion system protein F [bacterium ADurb.Bin400]|nr:MAG: Type II secretion system protein F [bacterium ADurb.Bin400]